MPHPETRRRRRRRGGRRVQESIFYDPNAPTGLSNPLNAPQQYNRPVPTGPRNPLFQWQHATELQTDPPATHLQPQYTSSTPQTNTGSAIGQALPLITARHQPTPTIHPGPHHPLGRTYASVPETEPSFSILNRVCSPPVDPQDHVSSLLSHARKIRWERRGAISVPGTPQPDVRMTDDDDKAEEDEENKGLETSTWFDTVETQRAAYALSQTTRETGRSESLDELAKLKKVRGLLLELGEGDMVDLFDEIEADFVVVEDCGESERNGGSRRWWGAKR
ncbi:hypothetical protein CC78DRAFT_336293 [Lojkania enalia]|uniref:Uncharacterized protein n=1 Tax=Lojkania enalia TaxID=147567 RepID=A0A9P4N9F7_9PLEO|nr:hypothetical protein CC78DRAFT_336293 [Didymosphaeria enalia]